MTATVTQSRSLSDLAEQLAASLASARLMEGRAFIRMPILFASGTVLVVVVEPEPGGTFRVSDLGQGHEEAAQLGVAAAFLHRARSLAPAEGLVLQGHELAFERVGEAALAGACAVLGSTVLRLVEQARLAAAAMRDRSRKSRLLDRLAELFPDRRIEPDAVMRGASTQEWSVDALLEAGSQQTVFDLAEPHLTSVSLAVTKMGDLAGLDRPPRCVAVVRRKAEFGAMLTLLSQAARVVEEAAPGGAFRRAAA
jgi:hypothetical protein